MRDLKKVAFICIVDVHLFDTEWPSAKPGASPTPAAGEGVDWTTNEHAGTVVHEARMQVGRQPAASTQQAVHVFLLLLERTVHGRKR